MFDLFGKKAGDKIILDTTDAHLDSNLYVECLAYSLVPYIEYAPLTRNYTATLLSVDEAPLHQISETIVMAVMNQSDPVDVSEFGPYEIDTLICSIRRRMLRYKYDSIINYANGLLTVSKDYGYNQVVEAIEKIPDYDTIPHEYGKAKYTEIPMPTNGEVNYTYEKIAALIYRKGKEKGFNVALRFKDNKFRVIFSTGNIPKHSFKSVTPATPTPRFRNTVEQMAWDTPYPFPDMSESTLRTAVHRHPLPCLVIRGNTVIKRSLMVGKHDGKVAVLHYGKPIFITDVSRKSDLTLRQQADIADVLEAHRGS